jgi:hypothetical protein
LSDPSPASSGPSLAVKIDSEKAYPLAWRAVVKRAAVVLVAGLTIYLVFPAITEVLASWPRLSTLHPWWLALAIGAEIAHFTCTFALQRLALRTRAWFPVITSQLASNAITLIMPGGAPVGAAVQFRMLAVGGLDTSSTVGGLAAFSLPAVVAGAAALLRPPGLRLPVPARRAAGTVATGLPRRRPWRGRKPAPGRPPRRRGGCRLDRPRAAAVSCDKKCREDETRSARPASVGLRAVRAGDNARKQLVLGG